jgi:hypothetical protein
MRVIFSQHSPLVAQSVEHLPFKQRVVGSIPTERTFFKESNDYKNSAGSYGAGSLVTIGNCAVNTEPLPSPSDCAVSVPPCRSAIPFAKYKPFPVDSGL